MQGTQTGTNPRVEPVTMKIEYRGNNLKHLHLTQDTVLSFSRGGGPVTLNVEILPKNNQAVPLNERASEVRLWFPISTSVFLSGTAPLKEILIEPITYGADNIGRGSVELEPNSAFPLVNGQTTTVPVGIYVDIDEGQQGNRKNVFQQKGRQMVDGAHSHAEADVGP